MPITASHGHTSTVFAVARRRAGERGGRGSDRAGVGQPGTSTRLRMAVAEARPPNGSSNEIYGVSFSPIHR